MQSEPSSGRKLTAYICICWLFHRMQFSVYVIETQRSMQRNAHGLGSVHGSVLVALCLASLRMAVHNIPLTSPHIVRPLHVNVTHFQCYSEVINQQLAPCESISKLVVTSAVRLIRSTELTICPLPLQVLFVFAVA